jgi:hypothetical protein
MSEGVVRSTSIRPDSIVNNVVVVIAPTPTIPDPEPQQVVSAPSQENYGVQGVTIIDSLLATEEEALVLAEYLIRPDPNYWFTGLSIDISQLNDSQRLAITTLDVGTLVSVTKSFKYGTPSSVTKNLYVEGIQHSISSTSHHIDFHFSPVGYSQQWQDITPTLTWGLVPAGISWTNLIWTIL